MNTLNKWTGWVALVVAIVALVYPLAFRSHTLGIAVTTNLPSLGVTQLAVGSGCDQQYTTCAGFTVDSAGTIMASSTIMTGGLATTTSTSASTTLVAADFLTHAGLVVTPYKLDGVTFTLPAASVLTALVPNIGDSTRYTIADATTSVAYITLVGATGSTLQSTASTTRIYPGYAGVLNIVRTGASALTFTLIGN